MAKVSTRKARQTRHDRIRATLKGTAARPRLCVFRSLEHIYVQVIDDEQGHTLTSASTLEPDIAKKVDGKKKAEQARVKSLAEAARKAGLEF